MYTHINLYVYIYIDMYIYIYIYTHTYALTYIYIYIYTHISPTLLAARPQCTCLTEEPSKKKLPTKKC